MFNQQQLHYSVFKLSVHCQFFCARVMDSYIRLKKKKKKSMSALDTSSSGCRSLPFSRIKSRKNCSQKLLVAFNKWHFQVSQSRARRLPPFTVPRIDVSRWEIMYAFGRSLQLIANTLIFATFIGFKSLLG